MRGDEGLLPTALCAHGLAVSALLLAGPRRAPQGSWFGPSSWGATSPGVARLCTWPPLAPVPVPAPSRLVFCPLRSHAVCRPGSESSRGRGTSRTLAAWVEFGPQARAGVALQGQRPVRSVLAPPARAVCRQHLEALRVACFLLAGNEDFRSLSIQVAGSCAVASRPGGREVSREPCLGGALLLLRFILPSSDMLLRLFTV